MLKSPQNMKTSVEAAVINKALSVIEKKLDVLLKSRGFTKKNLSNLSIGFASKDISYVIEFSDNKIRLINESSRDSQSKSEINETGEGGIVLSEWFFDPLSSTEKDAESIANDFVEVLTGKGDGSTNIRQNKKGKSKTENSSIHFFLNRLITIFPELKPKVTVEKDTYSKFRYTTFIRDEFVPLFLDLVNTCDKKSEKLKKTINVLNNFYDNSDMSVRSIITIIILNSIDENSDAYLKIDGLLKNDLRVAFTCARKYKNKKVKPEKLKNTLIKRLIKTSGQQ